MAKTLNAAIVPLRSETPSAVPSAGSMETGELAVNINDKTLFVKNSGGSVVSMPVGDVTLAGTQTLTNKTLTSPTLTGAVLNDGFTEEVYAVSGTTPALSPTNGSIQTWTLSGNSTPTAGTWAEGQSITLMIDDGTAYTITWTSLSVTWKSGGGFAPALNTTGYTTIALWKVGSVIYGARVGDS